MLGDDARARLRSLIEAVTRRPHRLPLQEVVGVTEAVAGHLVIDTASEPALVMEVPHQGPEFATLTPREREVARLVAAGMRNAEIADALYISIGTVKDHVHAVLAKTGYSNRAEVAAAWYGRSG